MNPATNDVAKKNDDEAIKQSLRNLILTKKYERPFQSELFSQLYDLLFEHFTASTKSAIQIVVSNVIKNLNPG
jgi:phage baseplate assembly protein W